MNRPEMMKALKEKGIAFTPSMKNVELEALLEQSEPVKPPQIDAGEPEAPEGQIDPSEPEEAPLPSLRLNTGEFEAPLKQEGGNVAPDTIAVDGKMFSKLVYDMTQGYTSYWTGVSGRLRLMEMCGATNKEEVEAMYKQLKEKYLGSRK